MMKNTLLVAVFVWLALWTFAVRSLHAQDDSCSHPIPPEVWGAMTLDQRKFQQVADTFTQNYILTVFGPGPYPKCLYQSVRDYFVAPAGASPEDRERARARRNRALSLARVVASAEAEKK